MADPERFTRVDAFSRRATDLLVWFDGEPTEWRLLMVPLALDDLWRRSPDMTEFYREHVRGQFVVLQWVEVRSAPPVIQP